MIYLDTDRPTAPAAEWSARLVAQSGFAFHVRPAGRADEAALGTTMMAADDLMTKAEVAIAIRADFKRGGVSWTLLDHVAAFAASKGIRTLQSVESRDNHQAIKLERGMGWTASFAGSAAGQIVRRKTLDAPAG